MKSGINCLLLIAIIAFISGCSKPEEFQGAEIIRTSGNYETRARESGDPYAINNILKAYNNLKQGDSTVPDCSIRPNNTYLRFLPANQGELELLRNDTTLSLFDYPLNTEMNEGDFSGEASSGTDPVYQYCVVPEGKQLPPVKYEVIYEVFIPPYRDYTAKTVPDEMTDFYEKLENESARITGNMAEGDSSLYMTARSSDSRWIPKGRIRAWDDILEMYIPLNHVNVHARWFTRVETALTDSDGNFSMKSFRYKVNYSIKWENSRFTIRDGLLLQAWYNGPRKKGDWILDIRSGKSKMFATIHRAAYRQFYGDNLGLFRPWLNNGYRTKISYMDGAGTGQFNGDFFHGLPDIQIWGDNASKETNEIFSTVTHELGHQLHSQFIGNIRYLKVSKLIRESWAEAVEWAITNDEYHMLGKKYGVDSALRYDHQADKHNGWPLVPDPEYSPAFIDLVDNINQGAIFGPEHPNDLISQYSIAYINFNLLRNITDIPSLRQEVLNHKMEGVDDFKIRELYSLY